MKQLFVDGKNLKRIIKLGFDISYNLGYDDFVKNEKYSDFVKSLPKNIMTLISSDRNEDFGINSNIYKKFEFLMKYDLQEQYGDKVEKMSLFEFFWQKYAGNRGFYDLWLDKDLDRIKSSITKNRFTDAKWYETLKITKERILVKNYRHFSYKWQTIANHNFQYIQFISLLTTTPLYIVYQLISENYIVVSEDSLQKHTSSSCIIQRLDSLFYFTINNEIHEEIERIKEKYKGKELNIDYIEKMMNDIKKLLCSKDFQTMRGSFYIKDWTLRSMESQINTDNTDFHKRKEKLIEEFDFNTHIPKWGKASWAKVTKKFTYGNDWKKKEKH